MPTCKKTDEQTDADNQTSKTDNQASKQRYGHNQTSMDKSKEA